MLKTIIMSLSLYSSWTWAKGDPQKGAEIYATCIQCHGERGQGVPKEEGPRLAGQFDWYIVEQLNNFKSKKRHNPKMYPFIKNMGAKDYEDVAAFISSLRVKDPKSASEVK